MSDRRLRALERRYQETGAFEDLEVFLREKLRVGIITNEEFEDELPRERARRARLESELLRGRTREDWSRIWNTGDKKQIVLAAFKGYKVALSFLAEQQEFTECECNYDVIHDFGNYLDVDMNGWAVLIECTLVVTCRGFVAAIPKEMLKQWLDAGGDFTGHWLEAADDFFLHCFGHLSDVQSLEVTRQGRKTLVDWLRGLLPDDTIWGNPL